MKNRTHNYTRSTTAFRKFTKSTLWRYAWIFKNALKYTYLLIPFSTVSNALQCTIKLENKTTKKTPEWLESIIKTPDTHRLNVYVVSSVAEHFIFHLLSVFPLYFLMRICCVHQGNGAPQPGHKVSVGPGWMWDHGGCGTPGEVKGVVNSGSCP